MTDARVCGACSVCCTVAEIPGFKAQGVRCQHLTEEGKCAIYETRPQACRDFECGYKINPRFREDERPERVGVLVMGLKLGHAQLNVLHELRPGALATYHGERLLKRAAKRDLVGVAEFGRPKTVSELRLCGPQRLLNGLKAKMKEAVGR